MNIVTKESWYPRYYLTISGARYGTKFYVFDLTKEQFAADYLPPNFVSYPCDGMTIVKSNLYIRINFMWMASNVTGKWTLYSPYRQKETFCFGFEDENEATMFQLSFS